FPALAALRHAGPGGGIVRAPFGRAATRGAVREAGGGRHCFRARRGEAGYFADPCIPGRGGGAQNTVRPAALAFAWYRLSGRFSRHGRSSRWLVGGAKPPPGANTPRGH